MSRLNELIAELCQDGVEFLTLQECTQKIQNIKWKEYFGSDKKYIDLSSVEIKSHCIRETQNINSDTAPSRAQQIVQTNDILLGTTRPMLKRYCMVGEEYDGEICSTGFCVLRANTDLVLPRWIYHNITTSPFFVYVEQNQKGASYPAISDMSVKAFCIPVPPLEVQREIVRVLDSFMLLTDELVAKLSTEIDARKKQYRFYRDKLLMFGTDCLKGKIIDMLSQPITDGPHTTPKLVENGIPFLSVEAICDGHINFEKKRGYITEEFDAECCKKYRPQKHDVFMVKSGSTTGKVGYVDTNEHFNIWSPIAAMRVNENNSSRFLYHLLQSTSIQKQVVAKASHGSQPNLGMRALEQFEVIIPPLEVQNRIANVLDNFEAICTDLNISLPAEIEARQKQYEYYRDLLLTFAEKGDMLLTDGRTDGRTDPIRAERN